MEICRPLQSFMSPVMTHKQAKKSGVLDKGEHASLKSIIGTLMYSEVRTRTALCLTICNFCAFEDSP